MEQSKVTEFVNDSDKKLRAFLESHPEASKFPRLEMTDKAAHETMIRVGIEARKYNAETENDIFALTVATLQNDHIAYEARRLGVSG